MARQAADVDKLIRVLKMEGNANAKIAENQKNDSSFKKAVYAYQMGEHGSSLRATHFFVPPDAVRPQSAQHMRNAPRARPRPRIALLIDCSPVAHSAGGLLGTE